MPLFDVEGPPSEVSIAERFRWQAGWCARLGSPLYADLLTRAAADVEADGPCAQVTKGHEADPLGSALPLRFMGAVHRLALDERAPGLAAFYPSAGGRLDDPQRCWTAFAATVEQQAAELQRLVERPVQTNEVGRAPALLGGFLEVAARTGLPLRLLEVGTSAGLNLRFDRFRYQCGGITVGDDASPVSFQDPFTGGLPPLDASLRVAERQGCDRSPLDPDSAEDRLTLLSYVWPDQAGRPEMLRAALDIARSVPAKVDRADAGEWATAALAGPAPGAATVLFHSIVRQYLDEATATRFESAIQHAADRATEDAPFAWLRMEPANEQADVRLTLWPGGEEQLIARTGYHGPPVTWLA